MAIGPNAQTTLRNGLSRRGFLRVGMVVSLGGTVSLLSGPATGLAAPLTAPVLMQAPGPAYLGCSLRSFDNPAHVDWNKGAQEFVAKATPSGLAGLDMMLCEGDSQKQISQVRAFVAKTGPGGVLAFDPNLTADTPAIAQICEAAQVYCWSFALKDPSIHVADYKYWVAHGAFDFVTQGKLTGEELCKAMGGNGKIVALMGPRGHSAGNDRRAGLGLALQEYPGVQLLEQENVDDWDRTKALNVMQNMIVAHPDLQGLWAANDQLGLGALEALRNAGMAGIPIVGVDAGDESIDAILRGEFTATASQEMTRTGFYSLDIPWQAYTGKIDPATLPPEHREFEIANRVVNKDNAQDYKDHILNGVPDYDFNSLWGWATGRTLAELPTYDPSLIAAP